MRLFVTANTARTPHTSKVLVSDGYICRLGETTMTFNYLTNSSGFTRITAYVGHLLDSAVEGHIEKLSQQLRPDPAIKCLNRPCELSEFMSRANAH
jgi:hypothetical protein